MFAPVFDIPTILYFNTEGRLLHVSHNKKFVFAKFFSDKNEKKFVKKFFTHNCTRSLTENFLNK
jgi:hypothetical protein